MISFFTVGNGCVKYCSKVLVCRGNISIILPVKSNNMAKATSKTPAKAAKKAAPKKSALSPNEQIYRTCEAALAKLSELDLDHQLQSEINWCLASFQNDGNPIGLYQMADRALLIFKAEQAKKTKGVTAKLVADIEKALKN
jgi:hypothetical protein